MDRIVAFLLLLVSAVLLAPGCIADEQTVSEATEIVPEVTVTEEVTETVTEEVTAEVPAFNVTADMNTTALNMTENQVVLVTLPENPTTGYTWNVTLSEGLTLVNDTYTQDAAEEGMTGVGGVHEWFVQAVGAGEQSFFGIEKQEWEEETGNETTYTLNILVE
ncbi:protease inhibitor I42 family protein [Methanospirillum stamsii]|uniref:Proteinase inhibitor I42 chagasin domain-containing protein n=1 Tax=Methanospirillum stamsii TaxID=1277351 RepID=A0A2V2MQ10_9EURY|nr:protease inhibitor I42 family protein [Methanospirillum stamsii]PWR70314.1 hypothetical protein DLD82_16040 [Methanospirillum stamsii]